MTVCPCEKLGRIGRLQITENREQRQVSCADAGGDDGCGGWPQLFGSVVGDRQVAFPMADPLYFFNNNPS